MSRSRRRVLHTCIFRGVLLSCAASVACGDNPTGPTLREMEVVVAGGDGQFGTAGQLIEEPLHAVVRATASGVAQPDVTVFWTVEEGDATLAGSAATVTDSVGSTTQTLRLGSTLGSVRVRVTIQKQQSASADFQAFLVEAPRLTALSVGSAHAGDTITLTGANFSTLPGQDVVLFSGIRGAVVDAGPTQLSVKVPECLASRTVQVTVQLGSVGGQGLPLAVEGGSALTKLDVGGSLDVDDPAGLTCVRVPGMGKGARYLVTVTSGSTVGAAHYGFSLTGLADPGASPVGTPAAGMPAGAGTGTRLGFAGAFERSLRERESTLVKEGTPHASPASRTPQRASSPVPTVGDKRSFSVLKSDGGFVQVSAVVRYVGSRAALYVDGDAPQGGFNEGDLATLSAEFDDVIYPTVTEAFGGPSDLDGNGRIAILFTPGVNRLTSRGSDSFVGGFFYGLDLLDGDGSNHGEVFYALVPDPTGQFSDARAKARVLEVVPAILAHEFQHMVHFNQRVLKLGAASTEALWLSEGLAQMSEELVARAYAARGNATAVERHREGNRTRARRFLANPGAVSLIVTTGQGSLEERGAGWLHVLYLWDRGGGNEVLRRLTQTTRTGTDNVTAVMGESWPDLLADWEAALYLDNRGSVTFPFEYPQVSLRDLLTAQSEGYPLVPEFLGSADFARAGSLWSSSAHHYIVIPPSDGSVTLRLGGRAGGNASDAEQLRLRVMRLF